MALLVRQRSSATEDWGLERALARLDHQRAFVARLLRRVRPFVDLAPGARVLDVGAAQGGIAIAFARAGLRARGIDPSPAAVAISRELAGRTGVAIDVALACGEALPYEDGSFDLVVARSVLEHVDSPRGVLVEAHRVLRPGGGLFLATTSALCPRQAEISGFPLFPWYPARLRRAIMAWAVRERPSLVGHTTRPAIHWFRHGRLRAELAAIGFAQAVDMWELRAASGELRGARRLAVAAAIDSRAVRWAGNLVTPRVEYLALAAGEPRRD